MFRSQALNFWKVVMYK